MHLRPDYDADAQAYFSRVVANGGQLYSAGYDEAATKSKLNAAFVGAKDLGIWSSLIDFGIFCGVGNLNGALVKAKNTTGVPLLTNNNFVAGDYSPNGTAAGLKGDGLTKYLATGLSANQLSQNSIGIWAYVTAPVLTGGNKGLVGSGGTTGGVHILKTSSVHTITYRVSNGTILSTDALLTKGFHGAFRQDSGNTSWVIGGLTGTTATGSSATLDNTMSVYARGTGDLCDSTISMYGLGGYADPVKLKTLCDNLMTSFGFTP